MTERWYASGPPSDLFFFSLLLGFPERFFLLFFIRLETSFTAFKGDKKEANTEF